MFGFNKPSRMKKLWTEIGMQLSDFFAFHRQMNNGRVPPILKTNPYVLGYLLRMCIHLYYDAVKGKTDFEEQGVVLANSLAMALDIDAHDISQRIQTLIKNPDDNFNHGKEDAIRAIEKIRIGDTTAFEEFSINIYKITKQVSNAINDAGKEKSDKKIFDLMAEIANSDPDPQVRAEAQHGIKRLFPDATEGFDDLISKFIMELRLPNDKQRRHHAAVALVGMGEISVPYVRPLLEDDDPEVRKLAIRILVMIEEDQKTIAKNREKGEA